MVTSTLPAPHAALLDRVLTSIRHDPRFEAVLAGGSLLHGGFDDQSDLDLILVVRPDAYDEAMTDRRSIAEKIGNCLAAFSGEHVGEPRLLICLFGPPLIHVDLKFVRLADLTQIVESPKIIWAHSQQAVADQLAQAEIHWPENEPQWFEDRAWVWLHYGATKLLRGELFEAIEMLGFFREHVLGLMLARNAGTPQRGVRRIDENGVARSRLVGTVPAYERESVRDALVKSIELYTELRAVNPPKVTTRAMPAALLDYIETGWN